MKDVVEKQSLYLPTQGSWMHIWTKPKFKFGHSLHCNGVKFTNLVEPNSPQAETDMFRWLFTRKVPKWENESIEVHHASLHEKKIVPEARPHAHLKDWQVWFVGHATVLLQIGPYNFLTDPVWCDYAGPIHRTGAKRVCPAGLRLDELPKIDAVLLSHNHYDHMDLATLNWLHDKFGMMIYTGLGNAWYLPRHFHVTEMDWWQTVNFKELKIVYTPAQHGSGRGFRDQNHALWGGFSLLYQDQHCFFAGDTGYSRHFKEIKQKFGAPRIAMLPIGGYAPRELMRYMHMDPEDAFQAHKDLQAKSSLAIRYRTFQLTDESREQPEIELHKAMRHSSKLVNPFYCIREGKKIIV
ncbi:MULTISPECIES: MBL fold metallo-hydrolase [unclassified Acinetobacter]|uniref:MBL fold metallo-hydrolase n=1 Tax=unclassified Acinetobacter TaxID=196816 RepID=UPI0029343CAF|nr:MULTISPECIES: MBL fold metallo-hydrolase [unclassified Acinetobacter]WOE30540.1 MBL fold metallo-hydrolase [Acinetobacter sp. SAAs470]WOE38732.1 MBL fold metallo-hydrolase [Acinetobacter sp. SAAs474]